MVSVLVVFKGRAAGPCQQTAARRRSARSIHSRLRAWVAASTTGGGSRPQPGRSAGRRSRPADRQRLLGLTSRGAGRAADGLRQVAVAARDGVEAGEDTDPRGTAADGTAAFRQVAENLKACQNSVNVAELFLALPKTFDCDPTKEEPALVFRFPGAHIVPREPNHHRPGSSGRSSRSSTSAPRAGSCACC